MDKLLEYRNEIDKIDRQLVELFEKRMDLSENVAKYKIDSGKPVLDRVREKQKIETLTSLASDDFNRHGVEELFTQVMAMSRKLQYKLLAQNGKITDLGFEVVNSLIKQNSKVVYQGVPGSYSHEAAINYFGDRADISNVKTFRDAMIKINDEEADYAVLPMENSTAGIVSDVYDLLVEFDNVIVEDIEIPINHAVLGTADAVLGDIKTVYSHPQALMQSSRFLEEHDWKRITSENTAVSAKRVAENGDKTVAAIGSVNAAKTYGLKVLADHINNTDINTTRFIIITKKAICRKD
ncbi:MAG: prephenate dehydratase domain-containing protein, partial [Eubacterium sp.]